MIKRRAFVAGLGGVAAGLPAAAQPAMPEVGFLHPGKSAALAPRLAAVVDGLRGRGFVEGQNVSVVARFADLDPQKTTAYAAELIERKVAAVLAVGPQAVNATRGITTTVPIVALDLESDPVKSGFIERLSHPGGNVTGLFFDFPDFSTKWLELLGDTIPGLARLGILWDPGTGTVQLDAVTAAAERRKLTLQILQVASPSGMDRAFQAANDAGSQAVLALSSPIFGTIPQQVAEAALRHRMPTITLFPEYAEAGGLMAYGTNLTDLFRQAGEMVGKVLAGTNPADLPVERPSRFELVVNLKTAAALGLAVPQVIQLRADRLIE
jgi:putative tryptophan/tyrosine transport system substrate-binding protein